MLFLLVLAFIGSVERTFAQLCTGSSLYTIRDETGSPMSEAQLKKAAITQIGIWDAVREKDEKGQVYFRSSYPADTTLIPLTNPLSFASTCGSMNNITLQYGGRSMRLYFENRDDWSQFVVDSLPFQDGIFQLKKVQDGDKQRLRCDEVDQPQPSVRKCVVRADDWVKITNIPNQK